VKHVMQRNGEGDKTSRTEMERSGNKCPKPCPVEESLIACASDMK